MADKFFQYQGSGQLYVLDNYTPYRQEVVRYLDLVRTTYSGQLLLKFINKTSNWILIQPFVPTPKDPVNAYASAQNNSPDAYKQGEIFVWRQINLPVVGKVPIPAVGTGVGANAHVLYHPANQRQYNQNMKGIPPGSGPGETLFHELVHAMRMVHGKFSKTPVPENAHMDNFEEFCAIASANVYRSERGFKVMRDSHQGFKPLEDALDDSDLYYENYKDEIDKFFTSQRSFCLELAHSKTRFNPFASAAVELKLMPAPTTPMAL